MKSKKVTIAKDIFRYALLFLPLLLLTFCQNLGEDFVFVEEVKITKDSKVVSLMMDAVKSDTYISFAKNEEDEQCTQLLYPIAFDVFFGDNPTSTVMIINSDEELIEFLSTLTSNTGFYIYFPVTLVDVDGVETIINDLTEFEGTLQMLVDACQGGGGNDDDDNDNDGDDNDGDNDGDDDNDNDGDDNDDDSDDDGNDDNDGDDDDDENDSSDNEYDYCHSNNKKVYICHKGQTICVSINAIWGHLTQHEEDYLGQCE